MKNRNLVILIILLLLIILFGYIKYAWKTVYITDIGTFKVPQDWIVSKKENVIYFTDKPLEEEYKIYLISQKKGNDGEYIPHYIFLENIEYLGSDRGVVYSNDSGYSLGIYNINGKVEKKYKIYFINHYRTTSFLVLDNLIDESIIKKIAKSYSHD